MYKYGGKAVSKQNSVKLFFGGGRSRSESRVLGDGWDISERQAVGRIRSGGFPRLGFRTGRFRGEGREAPKHQTSKQRHRNGLGVVSSPKQRPQNDFGVVFSPKQRPQNDFGVVFSLKQRPQKGLEHAFSSQFTHERGPSGGIQQKSGLAQRTGV